MIKYNNMYNKTLFSKDELALKAVKKLVKRAEGNYYRDVHGYSYEINIIALTLGMSENKVKKLYYTNCKGKYFPKGCKVK